MSMYEKNMKRAERRAKKEKMKRRAQYIYEEIHGVSRDDYDPRPLADHITNCSCPACGNPRRHFGEKTVQEKKADLDNSNPNNV